jgi:hypothetical protein
MKRRRYSAKKKQAIIEAVQQARNSGGKWAAAYVAAKAAGYKGSSPGLYQMIRVRGAKVNKSNAGAVSKAAPAVSSTNSISDAIGALISQAVNQRLAGAIAALEAMKQA